MQTFWDELSDLQGRATKGDVKAGIAAILKILSAGSVGYLGLKGVLIGLATFTPWLVPFITPAAMAHIMGAILKVYGELPQKERRVIAVAIGWLTGRISVQ